MSNYNITEVAIPAEDGVDIGEDLAALLQILR